MASRCTVCGKQPTAGRTYVYRGIAVKKGGIGLKVTGKNKRRFMPNIKKVRTRTPQGGVKTLKVCTRCLKSGRIQKA